MGSKRVKVVEKRSHPHRYGCVGTATALLPSKRIVVEFDDGECHIFEKDELRYGIKKGRENED